jgi:hypothetical protein
MGLRVAAVLAAAVIAVALGAAILATHHGPVGSAPASHDPNVEAYQLMMLSDYNAMSASTSNNCNTIQETGCAAALNNIIPTLQKWVGDLNSFQMTPKQFAFVDGQLRRHLTAVTAEMNAAITFQRANDQSGFDLAMQAVVYERAWIDPAAFSISGSYPKVAGSYRDAIGIARQSLFACANGTPGPADLSCQRLSQPEGCVGAATQTCENDVQNAATQLQTWMIALLQNPAPSALSSRNASLQAHMATADTALLAITDALLRGDSAKATAGEASYGNAIVAANGDMSAIGVVQ